MKMKKMIKSVMAGILTVAIMMTGLIISPTKENEAEAVALSEDDKVYYDEKTGAEFKDLYVTQNKKAPTKEGYLFGGWYKDEGTTPITTETDLSSIANDTTVYAKFVPAYVLSVKSQNYADTKATASGTPSESNKTTTRVVSTVDKSLLYNEVGFEVVINGQTFGSKSNKVWEKLKVGETAYDAKTLYGTVSEYFFVLNINNIPETKWADQIFARPYWITEDGTKVEGLGKYVYVEDGLKGYISVPVNLNNVTENIAAGVLEVDYDETKLRYVECRTGRVFEEMVVAEKESAGNKSIRCVGNVTELVGVQEDDMYITLRFEVIANETLTSREKPYQFVISDEDFANLAENDVDLKVWDVQY